MAAIATLPKTTPAGRKAGRLVTDLRRGKGLSPEALSFAIYSAGHGSVSAMTIRRIEWGVTPRVRVQLAVATFFGREVCQIWPSFTAKSMPRTVRDETRAA